MGLLTIGTSNRTEAEFFEHLVARRVGIIVDVRSKPWSRLPHFRQSALKSAASARGLEYEWAGELLGGLNDIATNDPAFLAALDRLLELEAERPVAIFCAEGDPTQCHRSWKAGAALMVQRGVVATNILRDGSEEPVTRTLLRTKVTDIPSCVRDAALSASMKAAAA